MRAGFFATLAPATLLACALTLPQTARGQDYLRGSHIGDGYQSAGSSAGGTNWSGFYAGGFAGYSNVNFNSSKTPGSLIANYLRNTTIENEMFVSSMLKIPAKSTSKESFGGFIGYNTQWDDIVLGIEADYTFLDMTSSGSDQISRFKELSDGYLASARVTGTASARLEQIGTLRGRIGYTMGNFMPYVTGGFAYGSGKITHSATVATQYVDANPNDERVLPSIYNPAVRLTGKRSSATMFGGVVGGGVEAALGSLLIRGEVLYARLGAQGRTSIDHTTARVGAGVKF